MISTFPVSSAAAMKEPMERKIKDKTTTPVKNRARIVC
jgi:hypothetical protein